MGKYSKFQRPSAPKPQANPIWRGIGCLLIVFVPVVSYFLMVVLLNPVKGTGLVPPELTGFIKFPAWTLKSPIFSGPVVAIGSIQDLYLRLILFFLILIILVAISSLVYTVVQTMIGPPQYGEFDAPPPRYRGKTSSR